MKRKKRIELSLKKMRIAQIGNAASIIGGGTNKPPISVTCPPSVRDNDCHSNQTLTRTHNDATDYSL